MLLSAVSVLVVAQSSSEIPEGLMNNSVYISDQMRDTSHSVCSKFHRSHVGFPVPKELVQSLLILVITLSCNLWV